MWICVGEIFKRDIEGMKEILKRDVEERAKLKSTRNIYRVIFLTGPPLEMTKCQIT